MDLPVASVLLRLLKRRHRDDAGDEEGDYRSAQAARANSTRARKAHRVGSLAIAVSLGAAFGAKRVICCQAEPEKARRLFPGNPGHRTYAGTEIPTLQRKESCVQATVAVDDVVKVSGDAKISIHGCEHRIG
jgi:hypothetical protein